MQRIASATLEELQRIQHVLESLKMKNPEAYEDFSELFRKNRNIGYKNIVKMLIGEKDPEQLKGLR